jgi:hypothetical protein
MREKHADTEGSRSRMVMNASDPKTRATSNETLSRHRAHCASIRMASRTMNPCVNHSRKV